MNRSYELMSPPLVYIIDDSRVQVIMLEKILTKEGFSVRTFSNGPEMIKRMEVESPALIISDIDMPFMNGFELMEEIQKQSYGKNIPFFFISTKNDLAAVERARQIGAQKFIQKPVKSDMLIHLVEEAIGMVAPKK